MYHPSLKGHHTRLVSDGGETLVVRSFPTGAKGLVDPCDPDTVVELQVGRYARLVRLSAHYGLGAYALTQFIRMPVVQGCAYGFAARNHYTNINLAHLTDGQQVDVLPRLQEVHACLRLPKPVLHSRVYAAIPVAA